MSNLDNQHDAEIEIGKEIDDPNYELGYQVGFDVGFIEGYEQGQSTLSSESESLLYNKALDDVIAQVDRFTFSEKDNVIMVLRLLQRV